MFRLLQGGRTSVPDWVELSNGCLCCSVKGEFLQALEVLVSGHYSYDYVLVETSGRGCAGLRMCPQDSAVGCAFWMMHLTPHGTQQLVCVNLGAPALRRCPGVWLAAAATNAVGPSHPPALLVSAPGLAHPGPIMASLWADEELEARVTLDGVVTVVDGTHIQQQLAETRPGGAANEAQLQVALADVILLNKVRDGRCGLCQTLWLAVVPQKQFGGPQLHEGVAGSALLIRVQAVSARLT